MEPGYHVEYMALPEPVVADREALYDWLERSWQYARSLPLKENKSRKKQY